MVNWSPTHHAHGGDLGCGNRLHLPVPRRHAEGAGLQADADHGGLRHSGGLRARQRAGQLGGGLQTAHETFYWRDKARPGEGPFDKLLALFDEAEVLVAYNGLGFDLPVLRKHYGTGKKAGQRYMAHRLKTHDPMLKVAAAIDQPYLSLNKLLLWNKLEAKTSDGIEAIRMWEQGRREDLLGYCMHDVRQLAQVVFLPQAPHPRRGTVAEPGARAGQCHSHAARTPARRAGRGVCIRRPAIVWGGVARFGSSMLVVT